MLILKNDIKKQIDETPIIEMLNFSSFNYTTSDTITDILKECASLFSDHYGVWEKTKTRVKLSSSKLKTEYFFDDTCRLHTARFQVVQKKRGDTFMDIILYQKKCSISWESIYPSFYNNNECVYKDVAESNRIIVIMQPQTQAKDLSHDMKQFIA